MKWNAVKYLMPVFLYAAIIQAFLNRGWLVFLPVLIAFGLLPMVELLLKPDVQNMDAAEEAIARDDRFYDLALYLIVPLQFTALYFFLSGMIQSDLLWWEKLGRVLSMGLSCGTFGINVGHELGHRKTLHEQWMAKALLLTSLYTHFFIEHNKGHHKHVSTPQDPSSAPYGMALYRFWWRSVTGTWTGAWRIAAAELSQKGKKWWSLSNEMLQLQVLSLLFLAAIGWYFGGAALLWFLPAAVMGFLLLESVNYIEHYGLSRRTTSEGKFEKVQPQHSWNSNHVLGRLLLFELSRHSDHHYKASRKYQVLRHHEEAPQLPTGYPGSILLALVPLLWFRVMDKQMQFFGLRQFEPQS